MQPDDPTRPPPALPAQPPQAGQPYPPQQPAGHYPPPYPPPVGYQQTTVGTGGLPGWMHALYAVGGVFTCGALWVVWAIHFWFAQSRSRSTTVVTPTYQPPPPQQYPHQ